MLTLREWRETNGLTRSEFADAINATPTGVSERLQCDEERVRRWEVGEVSWPRIQYRQAIHEVTGQDPRHLGFTPHARHKSAAIRVVEDPDVPSATGDPRTAGDDVVTLPRRMPDGRIIFVAILRRSFMQGLGVSLAGIVGDTALPAGSPTNDEIAATISDINPVEHFRRARQVLIDNDNLLGSINVIPAVQRNLDIIGRIRHNTRGADRRDLLRLQAQYAEFCGWLQQDVGNFTSAQYWTDRALEWSHAAADPDMTSFILARKSQLAGDMNDPLAAIDLAEAAANSARPGSRLEALAPTFAAHGYALNGEASSAQKEFDTARALLDRLDDDSESQWAAWLDDAYVEAQRARSQSTLGQAREAAEGFQSAIRALPPSYRRDIGVYRARESVAHAMAGEPEEAVRVGSHALAIAQETGSGRIAKELLILDRRLGKWRQLAPVARLRTAIGSAITTSPQ